MNILTRIVSVALVVLFVDRVQGQRHHHARGFGGHHAGMQSNNSSLARRQDASGVLGMGAHSFVGLATSYVVEDSSSNSPISTTPASNQLGGACGWGGMPRHKTHNGRNNGSIWGAAIQTKFFGKGLACGQCVLIKTNGQPLPARQGKGNHPDFIKVAIVDECPNTPGECKSIDMQLDGMLQLFGQPRVGQVPIIPTIVPCNFKANGIFMQVRQITNSPYDFRIAIIGNSGAIKQVKVSAPGTQAFEVVKSESNQYTLPNQHDAFALLGSHPTFDLQLTSFEGETIVIRNIRHNIGTADIGKWQNTRENFVRS